MNLFDLQDRKLAGRMIRYALVVLACVFMLLPQSAWAQADLTGYWVLHVPNGDGTSRTTYFELHQNGDAITGTLFGRGPNGLELAGRFHDDKLHFEVKGPVPASPSALTPRRVTAYDGSYQGGNLSLQSENFRKEVIKGIAERTTREATLPPHPLPLPALHNVPDNHLAQTPPMGWNSWNKFAGKVDDADVRAMADAMVATGMSKLGYVYINIDDTWAGGRDAAGNLVTNQKFPDMKALADYVHSKGLKIGIYSSPGPSTCAGYEGSFGHETQDAQTFAAWGIDYLKYDLCSARNIYRATPEDLQGLYQKMGDALQQTHRPIVYSLCEYGDADVWKWGSNVGGNLWRTTGDIRDQWASMDQIGFSQIPLASYARPGHWNDPDMLEVGNGGMNTEEYRTHMSLWSLLAAPLIAGNDLRTMSDDTKSILMNAEVIAIDQDPAAKPVQLLSQQDKIEVLTRSLHDGSVAVGIFNRGDVATSSSLSLDSLKMGVAASSLHIRDLWKHQTVAAQSTYTVVVPPHGVTLLKVR
jgi:alpha-galactosidase